ncbi:unnamed protein product [Paramecium pentaurelia]|uniref:Cyclin-dependent kinase 2 homolog n=1 Tax=Paramecium pentaurelia TaxID=43138 RepID=A0A8S1WVF5_9CILI|nr:unnamed protein product [Paramecium pentaurelia]CAD8192049.1 unnamed protein product [Paramecium pentaurelia]
MNLGISKSSARESQISLLFAGMQVEQYQNSLQNQYLKNFTQSKFLGQGTYGVVIRAFDERRGEFVALKKIKLGKFKDEGFPVTTIRKISILQKLKHPKDLKPENILLNEMTIIKLAGFGLSRVFPFPMPQFTKEITTLWYRAPELLLGDDNYGTGVDIWAVGCIMAECLAQEPLFKVDSEMVMLSQIMEVIGTPSDDNYIGLSKLPNYKDDFTIHQHKDLTQVFPLLIDDHRALEVLQSMLQFNPARRPQAKELLNYSWFYDIRNNY